MQIKNRKSAIAAGDWKYFTGKPCRHGHLSWRYTSSSVCCECLTVSRANRLVVFGEKLGGDMGEKLKSSAARTIENAQVRNAEWLASPPVIAAIVAEEDRLSTEAILNKSEAFRRLKVKGGGL